MSKRGENLQAEMVAILQSRGVPLSAYDLLAALKASHPKIAPPTVYRALSALEQRGQVHRLESLSAYIACQHEEHDHDSILSICDDCGSVEENIGFDVLSKLTSALKATGFTAQRHIIEVHGLCSNCEKRPSA